MARTKGSKNKPKLLNETEIQVAKKMGKPKVDWETLAKRLQQALASEIKESDDLKKEIIDLQSKLQILSKEIQDSTSESKPEEPVNVLDQQQSN